MRYWTNNYGHFHLKNDKKQLPSVFEKTLSNSAPPVGTMLFVPGKLVNGLLKNQPLHWCCVHNASTVPWTSAGQFGRPRGVRGRPWYDLWRPRCVISHPMDVRGLPQGVRPADGPGTHSLASTGPFSQAAVHRASGLLRFSQSQRGRIMDRKWACPQYVRNRKLMSRSCPGNATATLLAALTFFVKNKLILL